MNSTVIKWRKSRGWNFFYKLFPFSRVWKKIVVPKIAALLIDVQYQITFDNVKCKAYLTFSIRAFNSGSKSRKMGKIVRLQLFKMNYFVYTGLKKKLQFPKVPLWRIFW